MHHRGVHARGIGDIRRGSATEAVRSRETEGKSMREKLRASPAPRMSARAARSARRHDTQRGFRCANTVWHRYLWNADHAIADIAVAARGGVQSRMSQIGRHPYGERRCVSSSPRHTLGNALRSDCGLTGTHLSCEHRSHYADFALAGGGSGGGTLMPRSLIGRGSDPSAASAGRHRSRSLCR
jgi:hypothetical protein